MDLRDQFAAAALSGLLANYEIIKIEDRDAKKNGRDFAPAKISWFPETAYAYADEMIRMRELNLKTGTKK